MQCDFCSSLASVYYTLIVDGKSKKTNFCEACAAKQGVTDPEQLAMEQLKNTMTQHIDQIVGNIDIDQSLQAPEATVCGSCGFTLSDLKKTGRLGCSECYQAFRDEITQNLPSMHHGVKHVGKVPKNLDKVQQEHEKIKALEARIDEAIAKEDFEKAALLRDTISEIRSDREQKSPKEGEKL